MSTSIQGYRINKNIPPQRTKRTTPVERTIIFLNYFKDISLLILVAYAVHFAEFVEYDWNIEVETVWERGSVVHHCSEPAPYECTEWLEELQRKWSNIQTIVLIIGVLHYAKEYAKSRQDENHWINRHIKILKKIEMRQNGN